MWETELNKPNFFYINQPSDLFCSKSSIASAEESYGLATTKKSSRSDITIYKYIIIS